jgi:hypothetical protein
MKPKFGKSAEEFIGSLGPGAGPETAVGSSNSETEDEIQIRNFRAEFGADATNKMLRQRSQMRRQGINTWAQVFELAREDKERNAGNV